MRIFLGALLGLMIFFAINQKYIKKEKITSDLGVSYTYAKLLQDFKSPYSNIPQKMKIEEKYPPYFPLSYVFLALFDKVIGSPPYPKFYDAWIYVAKVVNLISAILLGYMLSMALSKTTRQDRVTTLLIAGLLSISFVYQPLIFKKSFQQFDAISFLLMLGSLLFLSRNAFMLAGMFLGLSICFKQSFIFILPHLLFLIYQSFGFRVFKIYCLSFASVCLAVLTPFFIDSIILTLDATIFFHLKREALRTYVDYSVPFLKLIFPELKPQLFFWAICTVVSIRIRLSPLLMIGMPVTTFFLFHTYFLEQYYVVVLYSWVIGFLLESILKDVKNGSS